MNRRGVRYAALIAISVGFSGGPACSRSAGGQDEGAGAASVASTASDPKEGAVEQPEPDLAAGLRAVWAAQDLDGAVVGASDEAGATVLVMFASWCGPCRKELAMLGELTRERPELRVIGVNYYEEFNDLSDADRLRSYVAENAPWLQVVRADEELFGKLGRPTKIPTLFLFDREGQLVQQYLKAERRAPPTRDEIVRDLDRALL